MPEGVSSTGKARHPYPIYIKKAKGTRLVDVDGNEYVDYLLSFGALILGHAHPAVMKRVEAQVELGLAFGAPTEVEAELAEKISEHVKSAELLRFTNSGTEAVNYALRVARGYAGRDKIAKFEGGFHGNFDNVLVSITAQSAQPASVAKPSNIPYSKGIGTNTMRDVLTLPFNDSEVAASLIEENADELAAVVVEPVQGFSGTIPAGKKFLSTLRKVTRDEGVVLIFDEVQTAFRLSLGGAQEYYGVAPDMVVLGKIIGGGLPVGAYGGRREIMETLMASGKRGTVNRVFQSGTFNGHPVTMAAGLATITELENDPARTYSALNERGRRVREGLASIMKEHKTEAQVTGVGSFFNVFFCDRPVTSVRDAVAADSSKSEAFYTSLLRRGIFGPTHYLSTVHTDDDVKFFLNAADRAVSEMAAR